MGGWLVFAPVTCQLISLVQKTSPLEEVSQIVDAVIVETVSVEDCLQVCQHHIVTGASQSVYSVVIQYVASELQRISLYHAYIAISIKGV